MGLITPNTLASTSDYINDLDSFKIIKKYIALTEAEIVETFFPELHFVRLVKNVYPQSPDSNLFNRNNGLPFRRIESIVEDAIDRKVHKFSCSLFTKNLESECISLRDIKGCENSKSKCGDFVEMNVRVPQDSAEAKTLEAEVFEGYSDYVAAKGDPANVIRQAWDGKQWFINSGGSHRTAALWYYDCMHEIDRQIDCMVQSVDMAPELKELAIQNYIWCFKGKSTAMQKIYNMINDHHNTEKPSFLKKIGISCFDDDHYALTVSKHSKLGRKLCNIMCGNAFDLSCWILNPSEYTFSKNSILLPKSKKQGE